MLVIILTVDRDKGALTEKSRHHLARLHLSERKPGDPGRDPQAHPRPPRAIPKSQEVEPDYLKTLLRDQIGQFLYIKTRRADDTAGHYRDIN